MPAHDNATAALTALRNGLLALHKTLLDSERSAYERDIAPVSGPGQMLDLLMNDPWFAYLRELSQFVVYIDEMLDAKEPPQASDAERLTGRATALLKPNEHGQGFQKRYYEAMQRDPAVVLAHGAISRVLAGLRS